MAEAAAARRPGWGPLEAAVAEAAAVRRPGRGPPEALGPAAAPEARPAVERARRRAARRALREAAAAPEARAASVRMIAGVARAVSNRVAGTRNRAASARSISVPVSCSVSPRQIAELEDRAVPRASAAAAIDRASAACLTHGRVVLPRCFIDSAVRLPGARRCTTARSVRRGWARGATRRSQHRRNRSLPVPAGRAPSVARRAFPPRTSRRARRSDR